MKLKGIIYFLYIFKNVLYLHFLLLKNKIKDKKKIVNNK
jgi:hypothetical protein